MARYINREILQKETGWYFDNFEFKWITHLIEKTGEVDFYLEPEDYFNAIRSEAVKFPALYFGSGRTEENEPYTMVYGIKLIMLSGEKLQKCRVLK